MKDFEVLLQDLDKLCSTVVGTKETEAVRSQRVKWVGVTEIKLCQLATTYPSIEGEKEIKAQQDKFVQGCIKIVKERLDELLKISKQYFPTPVSHKQLCEKFKGASTIMQQAQLALEDSPGPAAPPAASPSNTPSRGK